MMNMERATISEKTATGVAHSKLILIGEHSVVHGQPAISIPFPLIGVESVVEQVPGEEVYLESSFYHGPLSSAPKTLVGIVHTIKHTLKVLDMPCKNLLIKIHSSIPPGKGLGSSASVAIAVIKSLFAYADKPYTKEEILQLAHISETYAHGDPSGIDSLTITSSYPVWYRKGKPVEYIQSKEDFHFVVADTGKMADTKTAIATVAELIKTTPRKAYSKMERLGDITYQVREALEKSGKQLLGFLLNEVQKELESIGVSDTSLNRLIYFARQQGALGAKLTGGGNGGCIIALAQSEIHAMLLSEKLKEFGAQAVWPLVLKGK